MKFTSELRDATCQWDHTVLCATRQRWPTGWYSIYRSRKDERLSWPSWLVTYRDGSPIHKRSPIQVLTGSDVAQLANYVDRGQRVTTKPNRQPRIGTDRRTWLVQLLPPISYIETRSQHAARSDAVLPCGTRWRSSTAVVIDNKTHNQTTINLTNTTDSTKRLRSTRSTAIETWR